MRKRIGLIMIGVLCTTAFGGVYSGGAGEPNEPFIIASANDLQQIAYEPNDWDKCFKMVADVNLAELGRDFDVIAEGGSTLESNFSGVFDGNGYLISNLNIELNKSMVGLFGCIVHGGIVKNICLETVDVKGRYYVGGIAGRNEGIIQNSHVYGTIEGIGTCGGITGYCSRYRFDFPSKVENCSFRGQIIGSSAIGGIVGDTSDEAEVTECYAIVEITCESQCGGVVGRNMGGNFKMCFSKGDITCSSSCGGFAGVTGDHCGFGGVISDCYSDVTLNCSRYAGGFSGSWPGTSGQILNCYCSGKVVYDVNNYTDVGGFIGDHRVPEGVFSSYFLKNSGPDTGFGEPLSEEQMMQRESFAGWDFVDVWGIGDNQTYPYLRQYSAADISRDGVVNFVDFAMLADSWLVEK